MVECNLIQTKNYIVSIQSTQTIVSILVIICLPRSYDHVGADICQTSVRNTYTFSRPLQYVSLLLTPSVVTLNSIVH